MIIVTTVLQICLKTLTVTLWMQAECLDIPIRGVTARTDIGLSKTINYNELSSRKTQETEYKRKLVAGIRVYPNQRKQGNSDGCTLSSPIL